MSRKPSNEFEKDFNSRFNVGRKEYPNIYEEEWEFYASTFNMTVKEFKEKLSKPKKTPKRKYIKNPNADEARARGGIKQKIEYYEDNPTTKASFKEILKRRGLKFEDFDEEYSGIKIYTCKKYYYTRKK